MSKIYNSIQGDTWDKIAKEQLGSEYLMSELIVANLSLSHYAIMPADLQIVIPDINVSPRTIDPQLLPPWKRNSNG